MTSISYRLLSEQSLNQIVSEMELPKRHVLLNVLGKAETLPFGMLSEKQGFMFIEHPVEFLEKGKIKVDYLKSKITDDYVFNVDSK
jgi:hypothetical protein